MLTYLAIILNLRTLLMETSQTVHINNSLMIFSYFLKIV